MFQRRSLELDLKNEVCDRKDNLMRLKTQKCKSNIVHTAHYVHTYLSSSNQLCLLKINSMYGRYDRFTFTCPLVSVFMYGPEMRQLGIECLGAACLATYGPRRILADTWH